MDRLLMSEIDLHRFYSKAIVDLETGCWFVGKWYFHLHGKQYPPYRVAYEHFVGPLPDGLKLGHTCVNGSTSANVCAFWEHVRPVTHAQNLAEWKGTTTHCKRDHPRTPENTYTNKRTGDKSCRVCRNIVALECQGKSPCHQCGYLTCRCIE